jgi:hypothetical protein
MSVNAMANDNSRAPRWAIALIVLGLIVRVALAYVSWGSSDASIFLKYAREVHENGLLWTYHHDKGFNHPPLPGYYIELIYRITNPVGMEHPELRRMGFGTFPFIFKMPDVVADAVICWLLYKILRPRRGASFAAITAVCFAWSLDSVLLTGHECNTDPIYLMFMLLGLWLIEDRQSDFFGGVAMAVAINVKLLPVLFLIPLVATYRGPRNALRFLGGLAIGIPPFIPPMILEWYRFYHHVIDYRSALDYWGISQFLLEIESIPRFAHATGIIAYRYYDKGRFIMLGAVILMTLRTRRSARYNCYSLAAVTAALFMILTPGFGLQYTILAVPFLLASGRLLAANLYSLLTGLFLLFNYLANWNGQFPIDSWGPASRAPGPIFGLLAWATLIVFFYHEIREPRNTDVRIR